MEREELTRRQKELLTRTGDHATYNHDLEQVIVTGMDYGVTVEHRFDVEPEVLVNHGEPLINVEVERPGWARVIETGEEIGKSSDEPFRTAEKYVRENTEHIFLHYKTLHERQKENTRKDKV